MFTITAIAPTIYQIRSLSAFGLEVKAHKSGSYSIEQEFETKEEAIEFLKNRAYQYYDEFEGQADEHIEGIEKSGMLTIDAVTARIN